MNSLAIAVVGLLLLVVQSTFAPRVELFGARPDWLLAFVVFLGLYARPQPAVIAGGLIGLAGDLLTVERTGLLTLTYGLSAAVIAGNREYLFRYRATTQFAVTLTVALMAQTGWVVYRRSAFGGGGPIWYEVVPIVLTSLYTAALAPILHGALLWAGKWLGVRRPRYRFRELRSGGMDA